MSRIVMSERGSSRQYVLELDERPIGEFHEHMLRALSGTHIFNPSSRRNQHRPTADTLRETIEHALANRHADVHPVENTIPVYKAEGDLGECSICLQNIVPGEEFRRLPCSEIVNHCFHRACIDTWLKSNNTCPNCRSELFH